MIRTEQRRQRITHALLGRRLHRDQSTIKGFLNKSTLQTYLVWEMSVALGHNFFADLAQQLNAATENKLQQDQTELQQLKDENAQLRTERDYLRRAIDLLSQK